MCAWATVALLYCTVAEVASMALLLLCQWVPTEAQRHWKWDRGGGISSTARSRQALCSQWQSHLSSSFVCWVSIFFFSLYYYCLVYSFCFACVLYCDLWISWTFIITLSAESFKPLKKLLWSPYIWYYNFSIYKYK